jgi:hypothetical protein
MVGGMIGSFLPILPGPLTSWVGLLVLHLTEKIEMNWWILGPTLAFAILIWVLDYIIPAIGTKKFGGTRSGMIGTFIGLFAGIIFPIPFGIIIGPFIGALAGELINDTKDFNRALKAAFGSLIGFLSSSFLKFSVAFVYFGLFVWIAVAGYLK